MIKTILVALVVLAATYNVISAASNLILQSDGSNPVLRVENGAGEARLDVYAEGAAEGGARIYLPEGDILNLRNLQGGTADNPNLDIGAGSAVDRGDISLNWDVGEALRVHDGHKNLLFGVNENGSGQTRIHSGLSFAHSDGQTPDSGVTIYLSTKGNLVVRFADGTEKRLYVGKCYGGC